MNAVIVTPQKLSMEQPVEVNGYLLEEADYVRALQDALDLMRIEGIHSPISIRRALCIPHPVALGLLDDLLSCGKIQVETPVEGYKDYYTGYGAVYVENSEVGRWNQLTFWDDTQFENVA